MNSLHKITIELRPVSMEDRIRFSDIGQAMAVAFISNSTLISKDQAEHMAAKEGVGDFWVLMARTAWECAPQAEQGLK